MSRAPTAPPARHRRRWRWILPGLLVLSSAPWWLPNLPWVRQWVARRIALKTGLSCELGRLWLVTSDGLPRAERLRLFPTENSGGQTEIFLPVIRARIDWQALWQRRPALSELVVDGGEVVWRPDSKAAEADTALPPTAPAPALAATQPDRPSSVGLVPLAGPDEQADPSPSVAQAPSPVPETPVPSPAPETADAPSPPRAAPAPAPATTLSTIPPRRWSVRQLTIRSLRIRLLAPGPDGPELASAQLDATLPLGGTGTGHFGARSVVLLGNRPWPHPIEIPLTSDGRILSAMVPALDCPGGRLNLSVRCDTSLPGFPMVIETKTEALALPALLAWADPQLAPAQGTLEASLKLAGFARYPGSFRSIGQVEARRLVLPLQPWLHAAGLRAWAARVAKPEMLAEAGRLRFRSVGSQVAVDDASLMAGEATLRATGTVSPGTGLNFSVRAYLSAGGLEVANNLSAAWPPERRIEFTVLPNSPWAYLDFWIQGSIEVPEVALWGRSWTLSQLRLEVDRLNALQSPPSG